LAVDSVLNRLEWAGEANGVVLASVLNGSAERKYVTVDSVGSVLEDHTNHNVAVDLIGNTCALAVGTVSVCAFGDVEFSSDRVPSDFFR